MSAGARASMIGKFHTGLWLKIWGTPQMADLLANFSSISELDN